MQIFYCSIILAVLEGRIPHIFHSQVRKNHVEFHSANKSIAIFISQKFFNVAKFKFCEFEGVTRRSFEFCFLLKAREEKVKVLIFAISRFHPKSWNRHSSTRLVRTYLYPFLLCANLYFILILTSFEGQIPCIFCEFASEKCSGSRNCYSLKFAQAINLQGFLSFCNFFFKQEKVEYNKFNKTYL